MDLLEVVCEGAAHLAAAAPGAAVVVAGSFSSVNSEGHKL